MARKKIIAGNWKMNKTYDEGLQLVSEVMNILETEAPAHCSVVFCTPFIHLHSIKKLIGSKPNLFLGAQNCHTKESGAYTGEISAKMLQSVGVDFVIVGHSERREYFNESNEMLAEKVNALLAVNITPIFCCGEPLAIRETDAQDSYVTAQITASLFHLDATAIQKVVIAYEPIWAIGTGKTASTAQAQAMHTTIRQHLASKYGKEVAENITIQYGGSCNPANAAELFACPDVDGGLIGGASLKSRDFTEVIKAMK